MTPPNRKEISDTKISVHKVSKSKGGEVSNTSTCAPTTSPNQNKKKSTWKKPKDMPKRPLSAYNLFFKSEREKLVGISSEENYANNSTTISRRRNGRRREAHGKIGFADLARKISAKWKSLDQESRNFYEIRANEEREKYKKEVEKWKRGKQMEQGRQYPDEATMALLNNPVFLHNHYQSLSFQNNSRVAELFTKTSESLEISRRLAESTLLPLIDTPPRLSNLQSAMSTISNINYHQQNIEESFVQKPTNLLLEAAIPLCDTAVGMNSQQENVKSCEEDKGEDDDNENNSNDENDFDDLDKILKELNNDDQTQIEFQEFEDDTDGMESLDALIDNYVNDPSDSVDRELMAYIEGNDPHLGDISDSSLMLDELP